jgi:hypothetical protein
MISAPEMVGTGPSGTFAELARPVAGFLRD